MIDPSFWTDEKLGECTIQERYLFMGLISNSDDEGYGRANPKLLKSLVFPYDDLRSPDFDKMLAHLGGLKLIVLYTVDEQAYYYLPNFPKYQTINKVTSSVFPRLPDDYGSNTVCIPPKRIEEKRIEDKISIALFDRFWSAYPKKKSKGDAEKAFKKLKMSEELLQEIISAVEAQKQSSQWLEENGKFIPYPATWLNGKRWQDEETEKIKSTGWGYEGMDKL